MITCSMRGGICTLPSGLHAIAPRNAQSQWSVPEENDHLPENL